MITKALISLSRRVIRLVRAVLFPTTTIVLAPSISAQTLGLPITYRGVMSGFGSAIDVGLDPHGFRTFAGTGTVAIGRFAVAGATLPLLDVSATAAIVAGDGFAGSLAGRITCSSATRAAGAPFAIA